MTLLAVTTNEALWIGSLVVGLVVALLVWFLLERLRRRVNDVDRAVDDVWSMGKRLAQNTQATHLLDTTRARARDLQSELERPKA